MENLNDKGNHNHEVQGRLAELEQKLALLMINTEENFVLVDTELNIVNFNNQFRKEYKQYFNIDVQKGESILRYAQPERTEIVRQLYQRVFTGETLESEIQIPLADKNTVIFRNKYKPAYDEDGSIIGAFVSSNDITERRKAEEEKRQSEADLRAIFDNSSEGLMLLDKNGIIKAFNSKSAENHLLYHFTNELKVGTKLVDYVEETRKPYFESILERVRKGEKIQYDIDYATKEGKKQWFHASLNPVFEGENVTGICIARNNISERKIAEENLRHSHEILLKLTENVPVAIFQFEMDKDGHMSFPFMSKSIETIMPGITLGEILEDARHAFIYVHPEDAGNLITSIEKSWQDLTDWDLEYRVILKGDEIRWYKASSRPDKMEDRKEDDKIVWYGYIEDITERKMAEIRLQDLLNISGDQNKRLRNFSYIVSHNIRSHTSNIIGLVDVIMRVKNEEEKAKFFNMLRTSTDKLGETIENLNEIITVQNDLNVRKTKLNLKEEINKTSNAINAILSATNAKLINNVPENMMVEAVPSYLESILLNLMTNAIKYKSPDRDPVITIDAEEKENYKVLSIEDNGLGIDLKRYGEKIFGMYKTFHHNKDARGFGLFISKNQIEAMNGKIEVESELETGSTFRVYINHEEN